jgi:plastocyanin
MIGLTLLGASCGKATATNTTTDTTTTNTSTGTSLANSADANTSDTNTSVLERTVTITSAGMSSSTITVDAGTIVTFVNNDSTLHQIASNPHPTHTDLPGFDLSIAAGSSGSFTFSKVGSWGYHDHFNPFSSKYQGTVIVR